MQTSSEKTPPPPRNNVIKNPVAFPSNDRSTTARIARRLVRVPARDVQRCTYVRAAGIFMRSVGNLHEILMTDHEDVSRSRPPLPAHVRITTIDDNNYQLRPRGISISPFPFYLRTCTITLSLSLSLSASLHRERATERERECTYERKRGGLVIIARLPGHITVKNHRSPPLTTVISIHLASCVTTPWTDFRGRTDD